MPNWDYVRRIALAPPETSARPTRGPTRLGRERPGE
jgi:hypothetical protein